MKRIIFLLLLVIGEVSAQTFQNPLLPSGPDPWSIYKDGYYYYMHTMGNRLVLWKTDNLARLPEAEQKTIWTPPPTGPYSKQIWAPEIHYLRGNWYIYFAADDGKNENHRLWVLENTSPDPMQGEWTLKGKLADPGDHWAIDGSVFEHQGQLYLVWSGWEGYQNGRQDIYISKMKDPWTMQGERVRIATPTFDWERHGTINDWQKKNEPPVVLVNEGPQVLVRGSKVHIIYSASGCWTDHYSLGRITAPATSDLLAPASWKKHPQPVFQQSAENGVYGTGHNSFFTSPDGREDWILYHANSEPGQGCGRLRSPRAQKFEWDADDNPVFGKPVPAGTRLPVPAVGAR
ncbi:glycoside hydrolase family 43 protein [Telluribacter humicola]|uniref:glycoside hydrolase family 43 protein n=1 Tax=Telluribacter humicola TaxID=1720261 RepID=UPI001A977069|nr:glycoside hydrolase family 43 protein [Telluribacter humicola]